jgi:hypothetical protein
LDPLTRKLGNRIYTMKTEIESFILIQKWAYALNYLWTKSDMA